MTPRFAVQLAAPQTFAASLCPALFGIFYCLLNGFYLHPLKAVGLTLACVLMQASVNTFNDLADFLKGTDSADDNVEVSDATLVYENLNPKHVFLLASAYLFLGAALGIVSSSFSLAAILTGVLGGLIILLYSFGPVPLYSLPVGEIVSGFVMGGLIPFGITASSDGKLHWIVLLYSLPLIISIGLIMMSNNGCDIKKDQKAGRKTLPVLIGRERCVILFRVLLILWLLMIAAGPVVFLGWIGLVSPLLLALFLRKPVLFLVKTDLSPEIRILQMKNIALANLLGNGCLILSMMAACILRLSLA